MLKLIFGTYTSFFAKTPHFLPFKAFCNKTNVIRSTTHFKVVSSLNMTKFFEENSDIYNGLSINSKNIKLSDDKFEEQLNNALTSWNESGIRGIWFKVQINDSSFVPILVKNGFVFHHAKSSYVMLTKWLPKDEPNSLPNFPHTHIGVAGMVINDKNEVLVIQERFQQKPYWKLPGGYNNPGEEFAETAYREVLEETGIETEFISVVTLRHHHKHIFECSDIYVVCYMRPKSFTIIPSKDEIALCEWMDIDEYRTHSNVTEFNKFVMNSFLESKKLNAAIIPSQVLFFNKQTHNSVYTVKSLNKQSC